MIYIAANGNDFFIENCSRSCKNIRLKIDFIYYKRSISFRVVIFFSVDDYRVLYYGCSSSWYGWIGMQESRVGPEFKLIIRVVSQVEAIRHSYVLMTTLKR